MAQANVSTFVFDIETSGLDAGLGNRTQFGAKGARAPASPPRITQFALNQIDTVGGKVKVTQLIGGGADRGYTSVIQEMAQRHGVVSPQNIPNEFLEELVSSGMYDRQVLVKGSLMNNQVKNHIKHMVQSGSKLMTAEEQIKRLMVSVDDALTKSDSVRLLTYNKGFDVDTMVRELGHTNPDLQDEFSKWLRQRTGSGRVSLHGAERGVHLAMFEKMVREPGWVPEYTKAKAFDKARRLGAKTVGAETLQKHHALGEYVGDIAKIARGEAAPEQIYQGLSDDFQKIFKGTKGTKTKDLFNEFERIGEILENNPRLHQEARQHYARVLKTKYGEEVAAHVVNFSSMRWTSGWKQELIADQLLGGAQGAHDAVDDINFTMEIDRKLMSEKTSQSARATLADSMATKAYRDNMQAQRYAQNLMEHQAGRAAKVTGSEIPGKAAAKLEGEYMRGSRNISKFLGKMKGHKPKIAAAAIAGAAMVAGARITRSLSAQRARRNYSQGFSNKIDGLRDPYSSYMIVNGINPSKYPSGNVSAFGSGRNNFQDENLGFDMHPDVSMARRIFGSQASQRYHAYRESHSRQQLLPNQFKPSKIRDGIVDLSEYLIDMTDADTIKLREAWIDKDIPLFGSAFEWVQRAGLAAVENIGGRDMVENISPSINIRMSGIDAPETGRGRYAIAHPLAGEATEISEKLMQAASYLRVNQTQDAHGRYLGTFYSKNDRDINRQVVLWGGAMSAGPQYDAAQMSARSSNAGIFQNQFYHGVAAAQGSGFDRTPFTQMSQYKHLALGKEGARMYSVGAWAMMANPHMSGITDQVARNQHVMPISSSEATLPYNMGSLYS